MRYAASTAVSVEKSRAEIEAILTRYGAKKFSYATDSERGLAVVQFEASDRFVRFTLKLPQRSEKQFWVTPARHHRRSNEQAYEAWEQACRQRWRALLLAIKAKLEAVECKISTFEAEFMAHIVLPNGQTAGDWLAPQLAHAYDTGSMPATLIGLPSPEVPSDEIIQD